MSDEMIAGAEKILLKCITRFDVEIFDELRFIVYYEKYLEFDSERFPSTTSAYITRISAVLHMATDPLEFSYR